ncbi:MAG: sulfotransferase family protein [Alphaproteobacteria bacterium]
MHRSGTSLVTRLINLMGAHIGPAEVMLKHTVDNPTGFWERMDVLRANVEILKSQRCNWYRLHDWDTSHITPPPISRDIMQRVLAEMNRHSVWVMKDPRMCLTLPAWLPHLSHPVAVIASRHPLEVAHSLQLRNDIPPRYGLALWEHYAVHLIRNAHSLPRIFCDYNTILQNPLEQTRLLCDQLSANSPLLMLPSADDIKAFIKPAMKKATQEHGALSDHHQILHAMLQGTTNWQPDIEISSKSQQVIEELGPTLFRYGNILRAE